VRTLAPLLLFACVPAPADPLDADRDGVVAPLDCDDADPFVRPGALEVCNGRDDDCDGAVDGDQAVDPPTWFRDNDRDRYGAAGSDTVVACDPGPGWARERGDCDDDDPSIHPGLPDGCDGIDQDCDGAIDEDPDQTWYVDEDEDGFGDSDRPLSACGGARRAAVGGDCDDLDPAASPSADEVCNGIDDDCDGLVDDADSPAGPPTWFGDQDLDGVGVDTLSVVACAPPNEHWSLVAGDCDDLNPLVHAGALQRCDGVDNDCDGVVDNTGWFAPEQTVRIPLEVPAAAAQVSGPVWIVDVDFQAALDALGIPGPFDPASLTAAVQDCVAGGTAVPVAFADGVVGLLDGGEPTDPVNDGHGSVHILWPDGTVHPGEPVSLALYFGGPATASPGLAVDPRGWDGPQGEVVIDPDRGGLLDDIIPARGPNVLSQADASAGNGTAQGGVWAQAIAPGTTTVIEGGPQIAVVHATATAGAIETRLWWWGYAAHPAIYARVDWQAVASLSIDAPGDAGLAIRPVQITAPGLPDAVASTGPGWVGHADGSWGAAVGWAVPPATPSERACDDTGCWLAASEVAPLAAAATLLSGTVLVDHRVAVFLPTAGDPALDVVLPGLLAPVTPTAAPAEARP